MGRLRWGADSLRLAATTPRVAAVMLRPATAAVRLASHGLPRPNATLRLAAVALLLGATTCSSAWAAPRPDQPMDDSILRRTDSGYRFQTLNLDSADGQRHYAIWIGKPERPAPAAGYPVLYMLDGNAALGALKADELLTLSKGAAPVLVAVGYAGNMRIDRAGRTMDYTPGPPGNDPLTQQPSGGADAFLDLLEQQIKPAVARRVPLDASQQTLWGHSYGGLLVLHALLARPHRFAHYAAASPSLWWLGSERLDAALQGLEPGLGRRLDGQPTTLLLMRGELELAAPRKQPLPAGADPDSQMQGLLKALQTAPHLRVHFQTFPGLSHGPMLDASLRYLLQHQ